MIQRRPKPLGHRAGRPAAAEEVGDEIAFVAAGFDDAFEKGLRFLRGVTYASHSMPIGLHRSWRYLAKHRRDCSFRAHRVDVKYALARHVAIRSCESPCSIFRTLACVPLRSCTVESSLQDCKYTSSSLYE